MSPCWVAAMRLANQQALSSGKRQRVVKRKGWSLVRDLLIDGAVGYNVHPVGEPDKYQHVVGFKRPFNFELAS